MFSPGIFWSGLIVNRSGCEVQALQTNSYGVRPRSVLRRLAGIVTPTVDDSAVVVRLPMTISFSRHQFPPEIIRHAVWLYLRFTLSYRDVEDLLAERGLDVSYETVRRWVLKFGPAGECRS